MQHSIYSFRKNIEDLKIFLSELASKEYEISSRLEKVSQWESYEKAKPIIEDFEANLLDIEEISNTIDKKIYEQILTLKKESKLIEDLTTISVQLSILVNKPLKSKSIFFTDNFLSSIKLTTSFINISTKEPLTKDLNSIQKILISITRLSSLIKRLEKISYKISYIDDNIFKPSKVDNEILINYLDIAIEALQETRSMSSSDKNDLINYIIKAKSEAIKENPNWSKTIGALLITASLLSGVADAPNAYKNVSSAIEHIMGSAIEQTIFKPLPILLENNIDIKKLNTDEVAIT